MENEAWKEEYLKRAEERVRSVEEAQARIDELIARAGGPVMIVKNNEQYSASARMAEIDKRARMMAHQLNSPKYECTISIMGDEIIAQDGPPHARVFTARVLRADGTELGRGQGARKQRAEEAAAAMALRALGKN